MNTTVACLTPRATGGIATVGVRGRDAWQLVEPLFQPRSRRVSDILVGRFGDNQTDDVVIVRAPKEVEIHCHGGVAVVAWIVGLLTQRGAVEVSWEEWLREGSTSPLQAEAQIALAHTLTARAAGILLDQFHGAFARAVAEVLLALEQNEQADALSRLSKLAARAPLGRRLTQPWRLVLTGAPNVGKSSLANAILGYQRSITSPVPGTTRDAVTSLTAVEGWPIEIVDTAGLNDTATGLEAAGIERARAALATADLQLIVLDQAAPPQALLASTIKSLVVVNKVDLPAVWQPDGLRVSAKTGAGLPELLHAVVLALVPEPPAPGEPIPFTTALASTVEAAYQALAQGDARAAFALLHPLSSLR